MSEVVQVYKNIHKSKAAGRPVYSIRDKATRRVVGHTERIVLKDAKFVVSEAGRQRVLKEGRKNVHAWVEGTVVEKPSNPNHYEEFVSVQYNPVKNPKFIGIVFVGGSEHSRIPIRAAGTVLLSNVVFAWRWVEDQDDARLADAAKIL